MDGARAVTAEQEEAEGVRLVRASTAAQEGG